MIFNRDGGSVSRNLIERLARLPIWSWCVIPTALALAAIWLTPHSPMLDWPLHLGQAALLAHRGDPGFYWATTYCPQPFAAYHTFHYIAAGLYWLVGPTWVSRVMITAIFAFYAGAVALLMRSFRADYRGLVIAIPLFFGFLYRMGFGPNLLGLPLLFVNLALAAQWLRHDRWWLGLALSLGLVAAGYVHPLPFYLSLGCVGLLFLIRLFGQWRRLVLGGLWLVPAAAWGLWHFLQVRQLALVSPSSRLVSEPTLLSKIALLPGLLLGVERGQQIDESVGVLLMAVSLILGVLAVWHHGRRAMRSGAAATEARRSCLARVLIIAAVFSPLIWTGQLTMGTHYVYQRFLQPGLVLTLGFLPRTRRWTQTLLFLLALIAGSVFLCNNLGAHLRWRAATRDVYPLLQSVPQNSTLIALVPRYPDHMTKEHALRHIQGLFQLHRGGEVRYSFSHYRHLPFVDCKADAQKPTFMLIPYPMEFSPRVHGRYAEFVLIHLSTRAYSNRALFHWAFDKEGPYRRVGQAGRWLLVQRRKAP